MGPLTVMAFAGAVKFRKLIYESGLWMPLVLFAAISTSIFGCSLSILYYGNSSDIHVASLSVQIFGFQVYTRTRLIGNYLVFAAYHAFKIFNRDILLIWIHCFFGN